MGSEVRVNESAGTIEVWDEASRSWRVAQRNAIVINESRSKSKLAECYEAMGLSEAEAVIAAGVDRSVASGDVNRAFNSGVELGLFEAAKALGLTEAEAKIFADPTSRVSSSDGADGVKLKR